MGTWNTSPGKPGEEGRLPKTLSPCILTGDMKNRMGLIITGVIAVGLLIGLIVIEKQASDQQRKDSAQMSTLSNDLTVVHKDLEEQKSVAAMLEKDKEEQKKKFDPSYAELTNNFIVVSSNL